MNIEQEEGRYIPLSKRVYAAALMESRHRAHMTVVEIQHITKISRGHLYFLEEKFRNDPTMVDKPREGRPKKVDTYLERRIIRAVGKEPFKSSEQLARDINEGLDPENQIAASTVRKTALKHDLRARMPRYKPSLSKVQMEKRKIFAENFKDRDMSFWKNVLFSDEVAFQLFPHDRRFKVRRPKGCRNEPKYLLKSYPKQGGTLWFWGCINYNGHGSLILINGSLNADSYEAVLNEAIPETVRSLGLKEPYLLQDHAPHHETVRVQNALRDLGLRMLEGYPSNSPDLNPIEGIWSYWKTKVRGKNPQNLTQLKNYAFEEWRKLTVDILRKFITSMPERLNDLYVKKGGHTRW